MAGCQSFQWGAQYPDMVDAILPFCASAKTSPHNIVFLEGVKAALEADSAFAGGDYHRPPEVGLKAFARVYAGWAYSQTFYRERLHRELGFDTFEDVLVDWEQDHLAWDANDLLAKLWTWQNGDISAGPLYRGDFRRALGAIRARAIVVPCTTDLYFPPEDNAIEVARMPNAELRPYDSPVGTLRRDPEPRQRVHGFPERVRRGAAGVALTRSAPTSASPPAPTQDSGGSRPLNPSPSSRPLSRAVSFSTAVSRAPRRSSTLVIRAPKRPVVMRFRPARPIAAVMMAISSGDIGTSSVLWIASDQPSRRGW